jgi:hypothetical protein
MCCQLAHDIISEVYKQGGEGVRRCASVVGPLLARVSATLDSNARPEQGQALCVPAAGSPALERNTAAGHSVASDAARHLHKLLRLLTVDAPTAFHHMLTSADPLPSGAHGLQSIQHNRSYPIERLQLIDSNRSKSN